MIASGNPKIPGAPSAPARQPQSVGGVKTGFNPNDQAINVGSVMDRFGKEGQLNSATVDGDGGRAASDFRRSQQMADGAQLRRGIEQENSQQNMQEQAMRSELMQMAMSNQAKIYGDMAQRSVSQIGLASQLQAALMRHRNALIQSLMQK